jgi:hypothetical protein
MSVTPSADIVLARGLTRSAYEENILGMHWETYLPNGRDFGCSAEVRHILGGWTTTIRELPPTDAVLKKSVSALCLTTVARRAAWLGWLKKA